jgi:rRNA biogenesis protein RRP5
MKVKMKVAKVDLEKKRLNLSTKFSEAMIIDEKEKKEEDSEKKLKKGESFMSSDDDDDDDGIIKRTMSNGIYTTLQPIISINQVMDWDEDKDSCRSKLSSSLVHSSTTTTTTTTISSSRSDHQEEDQEEEPTKKSLQKSKRAKSLEEEEEEERSKESATLQRENELLDQQLPQNEEDYERLILASPNSSYLWIKFMAFQLGMMELDKARSIAERALTTIHFRDEQEKFNIWLAFLNMENTYGTEVSLAKVFERAINHHNNPKHVYLQMVKIYERSEKYDMADTLFQIMCKKFKESSKVWTEYGLYKLRRHQIDAARKLMQRSLQSLPKRKRKYQ